jgi:hypothetical protein
MAILIFSFFFKLFFTFDLINVFSPFLNFLSLFYTNILSDKFFEIKKNILTNNFESYWNILWFFYKFLSTFYNNKNSKHVCLTSLDTKPAITTTLTLVLTSLVLLEIYKFWIFFLHKSNCQRYTTTSHRAGTFEGL